MTEHRNKIAKSKKCRKVTIRHRQVRRTLLGQRHGTEPLPRKPGVIGRKDLGVLVAQRAACGEKFLLFQGEEGRFVVIVHADRAAIAPASAVVVAKEYPSCIPLVVD